MTLAKILIGGVGFAALAAAAPSAAQYYPGYSYNAPYGNAYGYRMNTQAAVNSCSAAVQQRLSYRTSRYNPYYGGYSQGRVLSVTSVDPNRYSVRVRGLATSGRMANNGVNLFGLLGSNYRADLSYGCTVNYRGQVTDVDINRR